VNGAVAVHQFVCVGVVSHDDQVTLLVEGVTGLNRP